MLGPNEHVETRHFDVFKRGVGTPEFMYTEEQVLAVSSNGTRVLSTKRVV